MFISVGKLLERWKKEVFFQNLKVFLKYFLTCFYFICVIYFIQFPNLVFVAYVAYVIRMIVK